MSIYKVEKNYEKIIKDFLEIVKLFDNQINPLIFCDDTHLNKILQQMKTSEIRTKEIAANLGWNFRGIGHWINKIFKHGICEWQPEGVRKVWKLTKRGEKFVRLHERIDYPKSRFMLVLRLASDMSIVDMASILGYSKEHYKRVEKTGYPWSYRKAEKILEKIANLTFKLEEDLLLQKLRDWLIDEKIQYIKSRGGFNRQHISGKVPITPTEKQVIGIMKKFGFGPDKDFFIHHRRGRYNIDIIVNKPKLFIEIVKATNNSEKTYLLLENALKHLIAATKNISSRVIIINAPHNESISPECINLIKGKAVVFFLSKPVHKIHMSYLKTLTRVRTIPELRRKFKDPTETIRSRLKSLLKEGLVKRIDKFGWKITSKGEELLGFYNLFLANNGHFLEGKKLLKQNIQFLDGLIEMKKKTYHIRTTDPFVEKINKMLSTHEILTTLHPKINTEFGSKFPDIVATVGKRKFLIECARTRKSSLYTQATRLAYKIKLLRDHIKEDGDFIFLAVLSCYDSPLLFIPPNKPFTLLNKVCDKLFIDSNINEIVRFIKGG